MNPLIKWPGGKAGEIGKVEPFIPEYSRYIEPFFGGGAMFFYLKPEYAAINDISSLLMEYYTLIKRQDKLLQELLIIRIIQSRITSMDSLLLSYRHWQLF